MTEPRGRVFILGDPQGRYVQQLVASKPPEVEVVVSNFSSIRSHLADFPDPMRGSPAPSDGCLKRPAEILTIASHSVSASDLVLVRSMSGGTLESIIFRMDALAAIERHGTLVLNPAKSLELAIDKYLSLSRLAALGIPVPATHTSQTAEDAITGFHLLGQRVVVKPLFGSEGRGLIQVSDEDHAWRVFRSLETLGGVIYQQAFIAPGGKDYRVLVVGEKLWVIQRTHSLDWRTNHARGGHCLASELPAEVLEMTRQVCNVFQLSLAGVDLIFDLETSKYLVLEVNGVPGWSGVATAHHCDIPGEIWELIQKKWPVSS